MHAAPSGVIWPASGPSSSLKCDSGCPEGRAAPARATTRCCSCSGRDRHPAPSCPMPHAPSSCRALRLPRRGADHRDSARGYRCVGLGTSVLRRPAAPRRGRARRSRGRAEERQGACQRESGRRARARWSAAPPPRAVAGHELADVSTQRSQCARQERARKHEETRRDRADIRASRGFRRQRREGMRLQGEASSASVAGSGASSSLRLPARQRQRWRRGDDGLVTLCDQAHASPSPRGGSSARASCRRRMRLCRWLSSGGTATVASICGLPCLRRARRRSSAVLRPAPRCLAGGASAGTCGRP